MAKARKSSAKKSAGGKPARKPPARFSFAEALAGDRDDKDRAQDLVYEAMDAPTEQRRLALATRALALDPENVDALLMMAQGTGMEGDERIETLRRIVAIGAQRLGKRAFKELVPHFWGFLETRPYMRARADLAHACWESGRQEEAAVEWNEMLLLNEGDNQGMRYYLLPCLLELGRTKEATALMERYPGECEWNVVFAWGKVLACLLGGDEAGAETALAAARKQNPHMEALLTGRGKMPKMAPWSYSPGSIEEAVCFVAPLARAWKPHAEAVRWLLERGSAAKKPAAKGGKRRKAE